MAREADEPRSIFLTGLRPPRGLTDLHRRWHAPLSGAHLLHYKHLQRQSARGEVVGALLGRCRVGRSSNRTQVWLTS